MPARLVAIVPAAGWGVRLGHSDGAADSTGSGPLPKAFRRLAGRSLVQRSLDTLADVVDEIVVAVPPALLDHDLGRELVGEPWRCPVRLVAGGAERQDSVRLALDSLEPSAQFVLVHDAARPLVPSSVALGVVDALKRGALCVVPVDRLGDSVRQVDIAGGNRVVDRASLRLVQTPQGFDAATLRRAHDEARRSGLTATDDAGLVEALGVPVTLVPGDPLAFKITRPLDLALAEALLAGQQTPRSHR